MATGLLSLKWNNHNSTFLHVLTTLRTKDSYSDVTLACDGRFYSLHKFVLSSCSDYFEEIFERTTCKNPVIVLKDIKCEELEALLNYMYVGEVNVVQEKLAGLIKAAECLKIKGLAVPDEDPFNIQEKINLTNRPQTKRSQRIEDSPCAKRRRGQLLDSNGEPFSSDLGKFDGANIEHHISHKSSNEDKIISQRKKRTSDPVNTIVSSMNQQKQVKQPIHLRNYSITSTNNTVLEEVTLDDDPVKSEPVEVERSSEEQQPSSGPPSAADNKDSLHQELGFDASNSMAGEEENYVDVDPSSMLGQGEEAMPGSSGFQGNSFPVWDADGAMTNFHNEAFSGETSEQMRLQTTLTTDSEAEGEELVADSALLVAAATGSTHNCEADGAGLVADSALLVAATTCPAHSHVSASTIRARIILNEEAISHLFESDESGKHIVYRCRICLYTTLKKNNIENHVVTHTDLQSFQCQLCPYKSNYKKDLVEHCSATHSETSV